MSPRLHFKSNYGSKFWIIGRDIVFFLKLIMILMEILLMESHENKFDNKDF